MKKFLNFCLVAVVLCGVNVACSGPLTVDNSVSGNLDLNKYLGDWYEIARFDHSFERGLSCCKANYSLREDGKVAVLNTGIKKGKPSEAKGKAKLTDNPRVLRVSFFGPFYGDYRILMLDEDYQWVLVGGGSDDFLWILAREPKLDDEVREQILGEATRRGYDVSQLIWVEQK
ncbi:MAG: lipocalin family protein [Bacteroidales bacterium]|nr:lipocalin family protein [Bacteroidales bacterium]